jgi:hypothetical protein
VDSGCDDDDDAVRIDDPDEATSSGREVTELVDVKVETDDIFATWYGCTNWVGSTKSRTDLYVRHDHAENTPSECGLDMRERPVVETRGDLWTTVFQRATRG